jgi:glycosyltransferase involved in cell wall biosynthesis
LCGAYSTKEYRKGFHFLEEIIIHLNAKMAGDFQLLIVGGKSSDLKKLDCDIVCTGQINSREKLAEAYSAANVVLLPYIEDNLPNVCLESLGCGTPVVSFAIGGLKDVIIPDVNGDIAAPFDVALLSKKLINCLESSFSRHSIRKWAEKNIDVRYQSKEYIKLFNKELNKMNY